MNMMKYSELSLLLILAVVSDIKYYKIKNKILLPFIIIRNFDEFFRFGYLWIETFNSWADYSYFNFVFSLCVENVGFRRYKAIWCNRGNHGVGKLFTHNGMFFYFWRNYCSFAYYLKKKR